MPLHSGLTSHSAISIPYTGLFISGSRLMEAGAWRVRCAIRKDHLCPGPNDLCRRHPQAICELSMGGIFVPAGRIGLVDARTNQAHSNVAMTGTWSLKAMDPGSSGFVRKAPS